jgi:hypothetical protein
MPGVTVTKPLDLGLLGTELEAASIIVRGLGTSGAPPHETGEKTLHSYDEDGAAVDLPAGAEAVVEAHVAPPLVIGYVETRAVAVVTRTTDGAFRELWRLETQPKHIYRAALEMEATDATDGTTKAQEARLVFKGLASSVVQVGTTTVLWSAPDVGTTSWAIQAQVQGQDLVFGVRGVAGKTIDWTLSGDLRIYAPEGLTG